jgi:hypothetical protein
MQHIQGRQTHCPDYIDKRVWTKLRTMTFVQVADHVDDLEEALRGLRQLNASLTMQNLELRKKLEMQKGADLQ